MKERFNMMSKNDGTLEQQNKARHILAMLLVRKMYDKSIKTLYEEHTSKTFVKSFH